ncbi:MAG: hypothetical protein NT129_01895 [Candidatus Aenigmarchaeota archaeon]|nr:hypothetical protein [Candidatus Aenigmarchaeota archaeon]
MDDYLESRLGIKELLKWLKTPEGKKFLYMCYAFFIFIALIYIFGWLGNYMNPNVLIIPNGESPPTNYIEQLREKYPDLKVIYVPKGSSVPDSAFPFRPYTYYVFIFLLICLFADTVLAMWYYKHVRKEPIFADFLIPKKYGRYVWMILGLAFILVGLLLFVISYNSSISLTIKDSEFIIGTAIIGVLLFIYGYK